MSRSHRQAVRSADGAAQHGTARQVVDVRCARKRTDSGGILPGADRGRDPVSGQVGFAGKFASRRRSRIPRPRISSLEARFDLIWVSLRPPGYPLPVAEYRFCERRWRFDRAWPIYREYLPGDRGGVAVELEGGIHGRGRHVRAAGFQGDCEKYNRAALCNWLVLRYTGADLNQPDAVVDQVAVALRLKGLA